MNDERFEDELLDRAIAEQRAEEPRAGLEQRVLARLAAAPAARRRRHWPVAVVVAAAAVVAIVVLIRVGAPAKTDPPAEPPVARVVPPAADTTDTAGTIEPPPSPPVSVPEPATVDVRVAHTKKKPPFPAERQLSAQEAMLMRFLRSVPPRTVRSVAAVRPAESVKIEKLTTQRLTVEPLRSFEPLPKS